MIKIIITDDSTGDVFSNQSVDVVYDDNRKVVINQGGFEIVLNKQMAHELAETLKMFYRLDDE